MNLTKLFEMQKELDERIIKQKGLEGKDLLPSRILALQVELGELANEWRGFKFWSDDQRPRAGLLEEYVDCLHFILSIGLEFGFEKERFSIVHPNFTDITRLFTSLIGTPEVLLWPESVKWDNYKYLFSLFLQLGKMLGFTWSEIEQAYFSKNAVNHERQEAGY